MASYLVSSPSNDLESNKTRPVLNERLGVLAVCQLSSELGERSKTLLKSASRTYAWAVRFARLSRTYGDRQVLLVHLGLEQLLLRLLYGRQDVWLSITVTLKCQLCHLTSKALCQLT
jgi:hypothetical protein